MSISNLEDLRNFMLEQLEKLNNNEIEISQAVATAKLSENVLHSVKTELEYARMTNQEPNISFMSKTGGGREKLALESSGRKALTYKK